MITIGLDIAKTTFHPDGIDDDRCFRQTRVRLLKFFREPDPAPDGGRVSGKARPRAEWSGRGGAA